MPRRQLSIALIACATFACGSNTPPSPSAAATQGGTITGRERIGWDQQATNATDLSAFRYFIYVDGARTEVADVSCAPGTAGFACTGRLPVLSAGTHTLELSAFVLAGDIFESPKSTPLQVTVAASITADMVGAAQWSSGPAGLTTDGIPLAVERIADGLIEPADMAIAPDGRVFVAERAGRIRALDSRSGQWAQAAENIEIDGGELLALTLDADFDRTHLAYVLYAAPSPNGPTYRLSRFRELAGSFAERAVLMNDIGRAADPAAGSLRAMPDGRLLIALGGGARSSAASLDGKVLRIERDGTTPPEQSGNPIVTSGLEQPRGAAWDRARSSAWIIDRGSDSSTLVAVVMPPAGRPRAGGRYRIPATGVTSEALYDGDLLPALKSELLIASEDGYLLRVRPPDAGQSVPLMSERLLQDRVGPILLVAVGPDGRVYFSTPDSLGAVRPCRRPACTE